MDLRFSAEDLAFRAEVREWLAEHAPRERRPHDSAAMREFDLQWQRTQYEGGWAGITWPVEYGGRGATLTQQLIWYEECGSLPLADVDACFVGLNHAGPTLMARARDEQKAEHLPKILRGEAVWCQGFSEPNAGSDLGSLQTRGVIDGDELVVSGQKIWTTYADIADFQELLVRTSSHGSRHHGLTWVICDMHAPGIDIRPIKTMGHDADFCEVFYDEVRIPLTRVVAGVDQGWSVAMATLAYERGTAFTQSQVRLASVVEDLVAAARERTGPGGQRAVIDEGEIARRLALARANVAALRAMTYAAVSRGARLDAPPPEGSMLKLRYSDLAQEVYRLALEVIGRDAMRYVSRWAPDGWSGAYLHSYAISIAGGTSEIQRNIIGERVLGLPDESGTVDLIPSAEQEELAAAAAAVLQRQAPLAALRGLDGRPSSVNPVSWKAFGALGLFGIGLAEELGGVGYGLAEETMVFREIGRILAPGPFIGSTLGARLAAEHDPGLARSILSGETVVALAEPRGPVELGAGRITGDVDVIDGVGATHAVSVARQGAVLFSLDGIEVTAEPCLDLAVRLGRVHLDAVPVLAMIAPGPGDLSQRGAVLAAAMLVGIGEAARDMAVSFAKDRIQFGKPIGAYQAIKHRAADMAVRAELAKSQLFFAALSVDEAHPDAAFQTSAAKLVATSAARENTAANVQIHGGMGYTYECDAHLYVTRTHILEFMLGDTRDHLASLIDIAPQR